VIDRETGPRPPTALSYLPAIAAGVSALVLATAAAIPFARVQAAIDRFAADGHAESFTPALHHAVVGKLRAVAIALLVAAPLLARFRVSLIDAGRHLARDSSGYVADRIRRTRDAVRRDPIEHVVLLVAATLAGAVVRALALRQPINYDEAFTFITYVRRPLWIALADYSYPNNHLLHTVLAHVSTRLFGIGPLALRLPAFIAGAALIPLTYVAARTLSGAAAGLIAAALVASSEPLIAFSVLARGYSLVCSCFLLALICAHDVAVRGDRRAWIPFVVVSSLGFYALPTFIYPFAILLIWIAWTAPGTIRSAAIAAGATGVIVVLLYLPAILVSGLAAGTAYGYATAPTMSAAQQLRDFLIASTVDDVRGANHAVALALAAAAVVALVFGRRDARRLIIVTLACAVAAVAVQRVAMPPRVWLFALPLMLMLAAEGIAIAVRSQRLAVAAIVLVTCADAYRSRPPQYTEVYGSDEVAMAQDVEPVTTYLKNHLRPSDAVVSVFPTVDLLDYYFRRQGVPIASLRNPTPAATRYLIVTNDRAGNSLDEVMNKKALRAPSDRAKLLRRWEYNAVFELPKDAQQSSADPTDQAPAALGQRRP
jgi:dolichyl-phosphate-mannose-protein mannosyltransferase